MSEETRDERGESQWFALARARGNVGGLTKLGRAFGALRVVRAARAVALGGDRPS